MVQIVLCFPMVTIKFYSKTTGGVVNVAGCHRVRPRLIFFTDGRPTDEATESGPDIQSNVNEVHVYL
jgi:hypothetical protein